ncbi:hypothetical protein MTO96_000410 [Rhipicephalus appendiculatus]
MRRGNHILMATFCWRCLGVHLFRSSFDDRRLFVRCLWNLRDATCVRLLSDRFLSQVLRRRRSQGFLVFLAPSLDAYRCQRCPSLVVCSRRRCRPWPLPGRLR